MKFSQNIDLNKLQNIYAKLGRVRSKSRSVGQIIENLKNTQYLLNNKPYQIEISSHASGANDLSTQ